MSTFAAELLHPDLLRDMSILVVAAPSPAGEHPVGEQPPAESFGQAVRGAFAELGARVHAHAYVGDADDDDSMDTAVMAVAPAVDTGPADAPAVEAAAAEPKPGGIEMLVVDGAGLFASGSLHACLHSAWDATRAVVNLAFLPASRGGRVVYLAPAPGAGEQAEPARAGLENLARTLSIEWARREITVVTIALGDATTPGEAAALTAYLASPAGAYFSGCLFDLRGP
jgi:NAD(P)-dependent dehydrogenase (short-subunit alcohol dehydrogenase family)